MSRKVIILDWMAKMKLKGKKPIHEYQTPVYSRLALIIPAEYRVIRYLQFSDTKRSFKGGFWYFQFIDQSINALIAKELID